jgi:low temperature requirement protein LtrA
LNIPVSEEPGDTSGAPGEEAAQPAEKPDQPESSADEAADKPGEPESKRVSWVELYFDLIFVFAVGQTTEIMVASPNGSGFGRAVGLFAMLWWTWIGFVVLYNRHHEDRSLQRLFVLAGTLPCAVAAVETSSASHGHVMAFAFALAAARLVLALAFTFTAERARQVAIGYGVSTAVFVASAFVPSPGRFVLWAFALIQEAGFLLLRNGELPAEGSAQQDGAEGDGAEGDGAERDGAERAAGKRGAGRPGQPDADHGKRRGRQSRARRSRADSLRAMLEPPKDPSRRVDAGHLAERFGLMIMILLGEVVVAVAGSAVGVPAHNVPYWTALLAGLVLAAALWWVYFTAAAPISESVLRASGGNPAMAYGLYAAGHLSPAFALLAMSAGVSLAITGHAPQDSAWFTTGGLAAYLLGSRVMFLGKTPGLTGKSREFGPLPRLALAAVVVCVALLEPYISAAGVVLVSAVLAIVIAGDLTWRMPGRMQGIAADPLSYFRRDSDSSR